MNEKMELIENVFVYLSIYLLKKLNNIRIIRWCPSRPACTSASPLLHSSHWRSLHGPTSSSRSIFRWSIWCIWTWPSPLFCNWRLPDSIMLWAASHMFSDGAWCEHPTSVSGILGMVSTSGILLCWWWPWASSVSILEAWFSVICTSLWQSASLYQMVCMFRLSPYLIINYRIIWI